MESTKTIKGLDDETWRKFKSLAAENEMKMPEMFKILVNDWKKNTSFWEDILDGKKTLTDKEAESMRDASKKIRAERGYRE